MSNVIKGKELVRNTFEKYVGFFEADVVAINPSKEELEELGIPMENDPVYVKEKEVKIDEEGGTDYVNTLRIVVYLREKKTGILLQKNFYLEDRVRTNKDGSKYQFIDSIGNTSWAADEESLPSWFLNSGREIRKARVGEDALYEFVRNWLSLEYRDLETNIIATDLEDLFSGDVEMFREQIGKSYAKSTVHMAMVRTVEKDGEIAEYQSVHPGTLPGYTMPILRTKKITEEFVERLHAKREENKFETDKTKKHKLKNWEYFIITLTDSEYPVNDYFVLEPFQQYDASKNPALQDGPFIGDEDYVEEYIENEDEDSAPF